MGNYFEFGILKGHDLGIIGAVIVAITLIAVAGMVVSKLSPHDLLALLWAALLKFGNSSSLPTLSSPAEQDDAQRAAECEGKGTQVVTPRKSRRVGAAKSQMAEQVLTPGSAKNAGAMASLARATSSVPPKKHRAARARRG